MVRGRQRIDGPKGAITQAVMATLAARSGKDVSLAEIYAEVRKRVGPASESGIRMALQNARPRTENPRRGFWRLAR